MTLLLKAGILLCLSPFSPCVSPSFSCPLKVPLQFLLYFLDGTKKSLKKKNTVVLTIRTAKEKTKTFRIEQQILLGELGKSLNVFLFYI